MIPTSFQYHRASSVDEAVSLLSSLGDDAKILAGGHSLIPAMKLRLNQAEHLIDISGIKDLRYIKVNGDTLHIGAGSTHTDIANSADVQEHMSILAETADLIGDRQVRNKGTIGGVLAHADPAADYPAALLVANAEVVIKGGSGERVVAMNDFLLGLFETDLAENEIITEVRMPSAKGAKATYAKFMQPASRYAIVGCAVLIGDTVGKITDARVAFTSVGEKAYRASGVEDAINEKWASAENISAASAHAVDGVDVLSDHFASVEYRSHLAKVYAVRALSKVLDK
ncbi:MAG: xanthine dehydrogenase family protein subunit M [Bacteroidota bacterium]